MRFFHLALSLFLVFFLSYEIYETLDLQMNGEVTTGQIVDFNYNGSRSGHSYVIAYSTQELQSFKSTAFATYLNPDRSQIGSDVVLFYNPEYPEKILIKGQLIKNLWLPLIAFVCSLVFLLSFFFSKRTSSLHNNS